MSSHVDLEEQHGYLQPPTLATSQHSDLGKPQCPYRIRVDPTQRIRLSIMDFRPMNSEAKPHECQMYMVIEEGLGPNPQLGLCEHKGREKELMTTESHEISLYFVTTALGFPSESPFLIRFDGKSCFMQDASMEVPILLEYQLLA